MADVVPTSLGRRLAPIERPLCGGRVAHELEEDVDMRARINLYKAATGETPSVTETDEEDEVPKVPLEELLDDMTLNTDMDQGA